ncbi:hypothetical protein ACIRQP_18520 [Streptomyces sp. NPDC102274]|uniref:hypothetical protein n=1 Tax=Streptomyces sp. NPDC102274 TaxID=3366151 RepID=UPI003813C71B
MIAVITRAGRRAARTPADAIGHAVHALVAIYRDAWAASADPEGTEPGIIVHQLSPYRG